MAENSFRKKWENYWYYYKYHTLFGAFILFVLIVGITQCSSQISPDMTYILVTENKYVTQQEQNILAKQLEKYVPDYNKDGKKSVQIVSIDYSNKDKSSFESMQLKYLSELQTTDSINMIVDDNTFKRLSATGVFGKIKNIVPKAPVRDDYRISFKNLAAFKKTGINKLTDNLYFTIREYKGSNIESPKNKTYYNNCIDVLETIVSKK
jgi:flagella basal body P-ring formation protein FlgA